jgi:membrane protein implicated in regulation of membrane protease activity
MLVAIISDWPVVETLLAIAVILILIDVFIPTEFLTHIGIILLCIAFYKIFDIDKTLWRIAASVGIWFVLVAAYYLLWKQVVGFVTNRFIAPTKFYSSVNTMIGKEAVIEEIDGKLMCRVHDEIWPFANEESFSESDKVCVMGLSNGSLVLEKK